MTYNRLNRESGGQHVDNFETVRNSKTTQLTTIVPFTKVDVIIESKKGNNFLMNNLIEEVRSRICVIIAQNIRCCIPYNTAEID